jgi:hypothetical protein
MGLNLVNLDEITRRYMLEELESDINNSRLYISPRLSVQGRQDYSNLLKETLRNYDDVWLANQLRINGRLNATEQRREPSGGTTIAKVPVNAAEMLAEGEFNRFYARGLCLRAIAEKIEKVEVYRAKTVKDPRIESERLIGTELDAKTLLNDLRTNIGVDTALGLPAGPNSGISVRFKKN